MSRSYSLSVPPSKFFLIQPYLPMISKICTFSGCGGPPLQLCWSTSWNTLRERSFSLSKKPLTSHGFLVRSRNSWIPSHSMLEYWLDWSSVGLCKQQPQLLQVHEYSDYVMSRRHYFTLVLPKPQLLQYFWHLILIWNLSLQGKDMIRIQHLWLSIPQTIILCILTNEILC